LRFNITDNRMHKYIFKITSKTTEIFLSVFPKCFILAEQRHDVYWMMILKLRKTQIFCTIRNMFECIRLSILPVLDNTGLASVQINSFIIQSIHIWPKRRQLHKVSGVVSSWTQLVPGLTCKEQLNAFGKAPVVKNQPTVKTVCEGFSVSLCTED